MKPSATSAFSVQRSALSVLLTLSALQLFSPSAFSATPLVDVKLSGTANEVKAGATLTINGTLVLGSGSFEGTQPLDSALTALAGLSNAANKLPYFTASDTFGTVDFSPLSQTLLALTTSQAWRNALFPSAPTTGDLAFFNGTSWVSLPRGTDGQVLTASATTIAYATPPATVPLDTPFIVSVPVSTLTGEFALSTLATGLLKVETTTGGLSTAVAGTDYLAAGPTTTSGLTMATAKLLGRSTAATGAIEELTASGALDLIGSTRGSLLYRGASGWVALTPGTSGHVLTSAGSGADPTYAAPAGGGSLTTLTWASSLALSFASPDQTVTLGGNTTFTTSNLSAAKSVLLRMVCDSTERTLTFPGSWVWVGGSPPTVIASSKTGMLSLVSYSTTDANVVAAYAVQP